MQILQNVVAMFNVHLPFKAGELVLASYVINGQCHVRPSSFVAAEHHAL